MLHPNDKVWSPKWKKVCTLYSSFQKFLFTTVTEVAKQQNSLTRRLLHNVLLVVVISNKNRKKTSAFNTIMRWHKSSEVESECFSHNFIVFCHLFAKNYQSWWKFDEVLSWQIQFYLLFWDIMYKITPAKTQRDAIKWGGAHEEVVWRGPQ